MPILISKPTVIQAQGNQPKLIQEFIGRVNNKVTEASIALMKSPAGWVEPGQTPEFNEYTVVLKGVLKVVTQKVTLEVKEGQAVMVLKGEWVQYSTPYELGAEYVAVCVPAFSPETVHRDPPDGFQV